jgi:hypothetical protein
MELFWQYLVNLIFVILSSCALKLQNKVWHSLISVRNMKLVILWGIPNNSDILCLRINNQILYIWSLLRLMNNTLKASFIQTYKLWESKLPSKYEINDEMVSEPTSIAIGLNVILSLSAYFRWPHFLNVNVWHISK